MPRGGKRDRAGRLPSLTAAKREEIARNYHQRMQAWAAAVAMGRDPNLQKRRALDAEMRRLAQTHKLPTEGRDEEVIEYHRRLHPQMQRLQAEIDALPNRCTVPVRHPKGVRRRFIQELAGEYGVSERMVVRCINEFDFGT